MENTQHCFVFCLQHVMRALVSQSALDSILVGLSLDTSLPSLFSLFSLFSSFPRPSPPSSFPPLPSCPPSPSLPHGPSTPRALVPDLGGQPCPLVWAAASPTSAPWPCMFTLPTQKGSPASLSSTSSFVLAFHADLLLPLHLSQQSPLFISPQGVITSLFLAFSLVVLGKHLLISMN